MIELIKRYQPRYSVKRVNSHLLAWMTGSTYHIMYDEISEIYSTRSRESAHRACDLMNQAHYVGFVDGLSTATIQQELTQ